MLDWAIYERISSVIILVNVSMNYSLPELISNLQTISISSSNAYYTYLKDKPLWRKSLMWSSQFLIKTKIAFVILYPSVSISLMTLKTSAYSATIEYILATERLNIKAMANNTSAVSIYLYLYLYIYLYIYIYLSIYIIYIYILYMYIPIYVSIYLSIYLSIYIICIYMYIYV